MIGCLSLDNMTYDLLLPGCLDLIANHTETDKLLANAQSWFQLL